MAKEYVFSISRGVDNTTTVSVSEHELTRQHKQLLVGEAIFRYKELTDELKSEFRNKLRLVVIESEDDDDLPF